MAFDRVWEPVCAWAAARVLSSRLTSVASPAAATNPQAFGARLREVLDEPVVLRLFFVSLHALCVYVFMIFTWMFQGVGGRKGLLAPFQRARFPHKTRLVERRHAVGGAHACAGPRPAAGLVYVAIKRKSV